MSLLEVGNTLAGEASLLAWFSPAVHDVMSRDHKGVHLGRLSKWFDATLTNY